ncbi:hypothetical protein AgCh_009848 [Apium graveolens]
MLELIIRRVYACHPSSCLVDHPSGSFVDHPSEYLASNLGILTGLIRIPAEDFSLGLLELELKFYKFWEPSFGDSLYQLIKDNNEKLVIAKLVQPISTPGEFRAFPNLIGRFKGREESVKVSKYVLQNIWRIFWFVVKSPRFLLIQEVPNVIKSVNMQLQEKSVNAKFGAFSVPKELAIVLPDSVADHIEYLIPNIVKALCNKSFTSNLKIEAFLFIILVLASHSSTVLYPYIQVC